MCVNLDSLFVLNPNVVNDILGSKDARGVEVMSPVDDIYMVKSESL